MDTLSHDEKVTEAALKIVQLSQLAATNRGSFMAMRPVVLENIENGTVFGAMLGHVGNDNPTPRVVIITANAYLFDRHVHVNRAGEIHTVPVYRRAESTSAVYMVS